jgi:hypothetical protein
MGLDMSPWLQLQVAAADVVWLQLVRCCGSQGGSALDVGLAGARVRSVQLL